MTRLLLTLLSACVPLSPADPLVSEPAPVASRWSHRPLEPLLRLPEGARLHNTQISGDRAHWSAGVHLDGGAYELVDGFGLPGDEPLQYPSFVEGHSLYKLAREGSTFFVIDGEPAPQAAWEQLFHGPARRYVTAPDGCSDAVGALGHEAWVCPRGEGALVVLDGVEQPVYDGIPGLFMSASGRLAYIATRGDRDLVVIDGSEGPPFEEIPASIVLWPESQGQNRSEPGLRFSAQGAVAYVALADGRRTVVLDHEPLGLSADWITDLGFAGEHLSFVAKRDGRERVVIDGRPGPSVDGISRHKRRGILLTEAGSVAYVAQSGDQERLGVGDQLGPAFDQVDLAGLLFSADEQSWAYVAKRGEAQVVVWRDRVGEAYMNIDQLCLSAAGDHVAYTAFGEDAVVVRDHLPIGSGHSPALSPSGEHWLHIQGDQLVVDGRDGPAFDGIWGPAFQGEQQLSYLALDGRDLGWVRVEAEPGSR